MKSKNSSGNVLFLILIAVALFAALSYAVTSSTRSGGGSISKEKARANASAMIQYATSLRNTMMRMKMNNDCTDSTFDFSNDIYKKYDGTGISTANSNAPSNFTCHLYKTEGGGAIPVVSPNDVIDPSYAVSATPTSALPGHGFFRVAQIKGIGTDGAAGSTTAGEMLFVVTGINKESCMALNDLLDVENPSGVPPIDTVSMGSSSNYTNGSLASNILIDNVHLNGKPGYCRTTTATNAGTFFYSIIER